MNAAGSGSRFSGYAGEFCCFLERRVSKQRELEVQELQEFRSYRMGDTTHLSI